MRKGVLYTANPYNMKLFEAKEDAFDEKEASGSPESFPEDKKPDDKLHVVNKYNAKKYNKAAFIPANVDRVNQNIFDGFDFSSMNYDVGAAKGAYYGGDYGNSYTGGNYDVDAAKNAAYGSGNVVGKIGGSGSFGGFGGGKAAAAKALAGVGLELTGKIGQSDEFKRGLWDRADPVHYLAGGRESEVGNFLGDSGVSVFKQGAQSGNGFMMLAGAGMKILGGLTNAAFGIKENKELKQATNTSIAANRNFVSNAGSFDDIKGPASRTATNVYEGGWFSGGKADDKNKELAENMANAYSWAERSMLNNIKNLSSDQISNAMRNYSAFGGYLTRPKRRRKNKR